MLCVRGPAFELPHVGEAFFAWLHEKMRMVVQVAQARRARARRTRVRVYMLATHFDKCFGVAEIVGHAALTDVLEMMLLPAETNLRHTRLGKRADCLACPDRGTEHVREKERQVAEVAVVRATHGKQPAAVLRIRGEGVDQDTLCLLYTSPSPRDRG